MNKQTKALKELLEAVEHAIEIGDWKVDGRCDPDLAINRAKEALEQKEQADIQRMGIAGAVEQLYLQSLEQPAQSQSDEYTEGYQQGYVEGWEAKKAEQPAQEPVAWWHDKGDYVDLNVSGHGIPLYTHPAPSCSCKDKK